MVHTGTARTVKKILTLLAVRTYLQYLPTVDCACCRSRAGVFQNSKSAGWPENHSRINLMRSPADAAQKSGRATTQLRERGE